MVTRAEGEGGGKRKRTRKQPLLLLLRGEGRERPPRSFPSHSAYTLPPTTASAGKMQAVLYSHPSSVGASQVGTHTPTARSGATQRQSQILPWPGTKTFKYVPSHSSIALARHLNINAIKFWVLWGLDTFTKTQMPKLMPKPRQALHFRCKLRNPFLSQSTIPFACLTNKTQMVFNFASPP